MKVLAAISPPAAVPARPAGHDEPCDEPGFFGTYVDDMVNLSHLIGAGKLYKYGAQAAERLKEQAPPLQDVPPARMKRPFMLVPGWTTRPSKFDHLIARLTEGGINGGKAYYLKDGQVYDDPDCTVALPEDGVPAEARIFIAVYQDVLQTPAQTGPQLDQALATVRRVTGADKVDAQGYSQGGLTARVYLDQGGQDIGKLFLLGAPNQGTRFARLACRLIRRDIQWALNLAGLTVADLPAMEWMAAVGRDGKGNPLLTDLNSRWDEQKQRVEAVYQVGGRDLITPSSGLWPMSRGDGLVESSSLDVGDLAVKLLPGEGYKHHGNLPNDSDVYREMMDFFGWEAVSEPPGTVPAQRSRVPQTVVDDGHFVL